MAVGHRDFTQKKPLQLVYLELGAGNGGMLLSISEDGFRFRAVSPMRENTTMPFAFSLDGRNRLEGAGTVEWVEEDGKSGGMRFTEVSPEFHVALGAWLNSDSSHQAGREVTPAAATPLDSIEKIRQELRSGYPARPASPAEVAKVPEQKPEPGIVDHSAPEKNVSEKNSSEKIRAEKSLIEKFAPPPKTRKQFFEPTSEKIYETKEPPTAHRLFPLPPARPPEPEKAAAVSSAFLKPPSETKKSAKPAGAGASDSPSLPGTGDVQVFSATSALFSSSPSAVETQASPPTRPYVPPLEESFEQAWERAKLTSPQDSPHLSRAAAGSIIAIALAVIFGALAYNFRQDIGAIFIQLGQSISGENRPAAPTPAQETKPDTTTPDEQNQTAPSRRAASQAPNTATESGNTANPPAASTGTNAATGATAPGASDTKPAAVAPPVVPPVVKPSENSMPGVSIDPAAKNGATADAESGQEEFGIARDILRGSNRQRDLPRAVELLWASVKKGHVPAEVTLADLYRRGDGVEKNCDQARVLLVAASKKSSLDAREMLQKIVTQGCE
jgi:hypothetical protein